MYCTQFKFTLHAYNMFTGVTKPISGYCAMVCRANSCVLIISAESLQFFSLIGKTPIA